MSQKSLLVWICFINNIKKIDIYFPLFRKVFSAHYCCEEDWLKEYINLYFYAAQYFKYVEPSSTLIRAKN